MEQHAREHAPPARALAIPHPNIHTPTPSGVRQTKRRKRERPLCSAVQCMCCGMDAPVNAGDALAVLLEHRNGVELAG